MEFIRTNGVTEGEERTNLQCEGGMAPTAGAEPGCSRESGQYVHRPRHAGHLPLPPQVHLQQVGTGSAAAGHQTGAHELTVLGRGLTCSATVPAPIHCLK